MTNQVIPEAAVEAAVAELVAQKWEISAKEAAHDYWEPERDAERQNARAILEAAAPHMCEVQWGVRDVVSLITAGHPSEESARAAAAAHPKWYEVVSRPMPGLWSAK